MPPPTNPQANWVKEEKHGDSSCTERKTDVQSDLSEMQIKTNLQACCFCYGTLVWHLSRSKWCLLNPITTVHLIWVSFIWWQTQDGCLCGYKTFFWSSVTVALIGYRYIPLCPWREKGTRPILIAEFVWQCQSTEFVHGQQKLSDSLK